MSIPKILVVEDDNNLRFFLVQLFQREGYHVTVAPDGDTAMERIAAEEFDLAILDLNLGLGPSGMDVLAVLRQQWPATGVILLTGHGTLETAITALRLGAHDYLLKPARIAEIRQSVQRGLAAKQKQQPPPPGSGETLVSPLPPDPSPPGQPKESRPPGLVIDHLRHEITLDGHLLPLSPAEFDLLVYLAKESPRLVSAQEIIREIHHYEASELEARDLVRSIIYRLRNKIKDASGHTDVIRNVRGVGYSLED
jgi:two-component system alkaline phosphatase synthesis response regulator PhoP